MGSRGRTVKDPRERGYVRVDIDGGTHVYRAGHVRVG